jgi:hypothetical protein
MRLADGGWLRLPEGDWRRSLVPEGHSPTTATHEDIHRAQVAALGAHRGIMDRPTMIALPHMDGPEPDANFIDPDPDPEWPR